MMRIRALIVLTLASALALPCALPPALSAQIIRFPRRAGRTQPRDRPMPPRVKPVAQAMAYRRSRWSVESYPMISSVQMPGPLGGGTSYTVAGAGVMGEFRGLERVSGTFDVTSSIPGTSMSMQTIELGTRLHAVRSDRQLRPFVDVRAAYAHMNDLFAGSVSTGGPLFSQQFVQGMQYSEGYGGIAGAGIEYSLTARVSVTTELSALRGRMTTYRLSAPTSFPVSDASYWMTAFRYTIGLRFTPVHVMNLK
jgi:hypothetical protein